VAVDAGKGARRRPLDEGLGDTPVEAADPSGRWWIRARTVASVGVFLRQCALGKVELWSHNVNDTQWSCFKLASSPPPPPPSSRTLLQR
jgi:hypothetical protein